jgi:hypothetical protein
MDLKEIKKLFSLWFPPIIWAAYIFKLSSGKIATVSDVYWYEFTIKSFAHVLFFGLLTILIYRALRGSGFKRKKSGYYTLYVLIIYALTDELHQSFVPGRDARIHDVVFDTIGAVIVIYAIWELLPRVPKRLRDWAEKLQLM